MTTYAATIPVPGTKRVVPRTITQSEFPYRVQCYQFKGLQAARDFSAALAATANSGHKHKVGMFHRRMQMEIAANGGVLVEAPILLDVTTDSPEEAEAKYEVTP